MLYCLCLWKGELSEKEIVKHSFIIAKETQGVSFIGTYDLAWVPSILKGLFVRQAGDISIFLKKEDNYCLGKGYQGHSGQVMGH